MTRLGIAAESASDVALLTDMADRIVVAVVPWIEHEVLAAYRTWCGSGDGASNKPPLSETGRF